MKTIQITETKNKRMKQVVEDHGDKFHLLDAQNKVFVVTPVADRDKWVGAFNLREATFVELP